VHEPPGKVAALPLVGVTVPPLASNVIVNAVSGATPAPLHRPLESAPSSPQPTQKSATNTAIPAIFKIVLFFITPPIKKFSFD
jgi:hypothetical protein